MSKVNELIKRNFENPHIYFLTLLALLSGALIGTSYIPYPPWALGFCYLPLWWATIKATEQGKSYKLIFFLGWLTQFTLTLLGFNWIYFTAREFGYLNIPLSLASVVLFAAFIHLYIPAALVLVAYLKKKFVLNHSSFIFVLAITHILFERAWPSIFEWNLGYTLLWVNSPLSQWADTVGFWGLSALIFIFQAGVFYALSNWSLQKTKSLCAALLLVITTTFLWIGGQLKQQKYRNTQDSINVTLVQANISNEEKLQSEKGYDYVPYVLNTYFHATENELIKNNNNTDLIIWPETALPMALDKNYFDRTNQLTVLNRVKAWNKYLITGAYSQDTTKRDHLGNLIVRNSVFFLDQTGEAQSPYFKTDLLVFGEYMPFGQELPFLYKLFPFVGVYERGHGPTAKSVLLPIGKHIQLGPQICYESLNPGFSRELVKKNVDIIFNLTNDSWFGDWAEPYQHMIMTLARGLENRRPLIRATNTGISTVILASGDILTQSPIYKDWTHTYSVPFTKTTELTTYTQYGYLDWVFWSAILILILVFNYFKRGSRADH